MAELVYLRPGEKMPDHEEEPWLVIEASSDGRFFGTGASRRACGEWVGYGSLAEHVNSLKDALSAAQEWAEKYQVQTIWIQADPS
ncbi:hypothetical protein [uncultured Erythrobacter sp.]|uniref:hypothetical protein n=1 Tax=uncultured Erythrobacter sp. TaxID=263913 RepID=UPI002616F3F0|nr:hypothetical protein [uncultured Erythrobacter sp.]